MSPSRAGVQLAAALAALAAVTLLAVRGAEPFRGWYYPLAWYPTLVAADAAFVLRTGASPLFGRPRFALSLFLWSIPVWLLFEAANFRLANWYYVNAAPHRALRWGGGAAAFATVLPAIFLAHAWMERLGLAESWRRPRFDAGPRHRRPLLALGCLFVLLAAWRPDAFFPLVWGAVTLLLEPFNHRRDPERSLLGDLSRGSYARIVRLLAAGAVVGLVWEALNSFAGARWIYTVPGLDEGKLFEMPVAGYLGFPVFALDCFVLYQTLVLKGVALPGWSRGAAPARFSPRRAALAGSAAAALSLLVFAGMDRWTVDSFGSSLEDLPGVGRGAVPALRQAGIPSLERLAGADPSAVASITRLEPAPARDAVRFARLAALRGIGAGNAEALRAAGMGAPCQLAAAGEEAVSRAIRAVRRDPYAGRPARVRVWLGAAREECAASGRP